MEEHNLRSDYIDYTKLISEISKDVSDTFTHKEFLNNVFEKVSSFMNIKGVYLFLGKKNKSSLEYAEYCNEKYFYEIIDKGDISKCIVGYYKSIPDDCNTVVCNDVSINDHCCIKKEFNARNIQSYIMAPIYQNQEKIGTVLFFKDLPYEWKSEEMNMLQTVALLLNIELCNDRINSRVEVERKKFELAISSIGEGVIIADTNARIEFANKHALEILEVSSLTMEHKIGDFCEFAWDSPENDTMDPIKIVLSTRESLSWGNPFRVILKSGATKIIDCCCDLITHSDGDVHGVIMLFWDITDEINKNRRLDYLSKYDEMTGLYNRSYLEMLFEEIDKKENYPLAVIMGDLNGLKLTNDVYGHSVGDVILKKSGGIVGDLTKEEHGVCGRWGGDEFLMIMPRMSEKDADKFCRRIKCKFNTIGNDLNQDSISLGYSCKSEVKYDLHDIISQAESFMYEKKLMESKSLRNSLIKSIQQTLHEKSYETEEHATRLCDLSREIGLYMKLSSKEMSDLELLSILHDIGKVTVSNSILEKKGRLSEDEWIIMKRHSESGFRILKAIPELSHIADYVLCHHERWDGLGYPQGLMGEEIPLLSRIVSIVDSYDAMTNDRSYRKALGKELALSEIERNLGKQFDPFVGKIFLEIMS